MSVCVAKDCDLEIENAALGLRPRAIFPRPRPQLFFFLTIPASKLANNVHMYPQRKAVFSSTYTNKIYRFVKMNLFAVAQGMLKNFIMLVYV